ncbi:MAG: single-stranded-DNA-specific exonuclease RecJ [Chloroflexota bacterium]|nr:single-stranded-DNA-specific exonuclease RecJ [Chloroflexota bacterium]
MPVPELWTLKRKCPSEFVRRFPSLDPLLTQVLYARGIDTPSKVNAFLNVPKTLANPFQMTGMNEAVARLQQALTKDERIIVYGDYDVDGVSATALLVSALRGLGGKVEAYIPDRFSEAYGLNKAALEKLHQEGTGLVVTVDCGIRSAEEVAYAGSLGLDMIVTDHHSVPKEIPPAVAVLDPKRPDCYYDFKELAGVGVAYQLVQALTEAQHVRGLRGIDPEQFLDLVALGTVADIVPLTEENRSLAHWGLRRMRESPRMGLLKLMEKAGVQPEQVDGEAIGFRLGPRINAAGRLEHARLAYRLLMTNVEEEAEELADRLHRINLERQQLLDRQCRHARELVDSQETGPVLIIDDPTFHEGIVGLIASRLTETFYRPTLVMRRGERDTRGSARSIEGFHITHALDHCADLLFRYGGHAAAAGFSLPTENLPAFRECLERYCAERIGEEMLQRRIRVDAIVPLKALDENTPQLLRRIAPFGEGNPAPSLASVDLDLLSLRPVGSGDRHLRLSVGDGIRSLSAIAFRQGHLAKRLSLGDKVDMVYTPSLNTYRGKTSLQLVVQAIRKSE